MEQHLTCLTGPANRLPFEIVTMSDLVGLMTFLLLRIDGSHRALLRSWPTKKDISSGSKSHGRGSGPAVLRRSAVGRQLWSENFRSGSNSAESAISPLRRICLR